MVLTVPFQPPWGRPDQGSFCSQFIVLYCLAACPALWWLGHNGGSELLSLEAGRAQV